MARTGVKLAVTVQSAVMAAAVKVVPANEPLQLPLTLVTNPEFGVTVKVVVPPCAMDCTMLGEIVPFAPVLGVTLKNAVQDVAPATSELVPCGHTVWLVAPLIETKKPGCASPHAVHASQKIRHCARHGGVVHRDIDCAERSCQSYCCGVADGGEGEDTYDRELGKSCTVEANENHFYLCGTVKIRLDEKQYFPMIAIVLRQAVIADGDCKH